MSAINITQVQVLVRVYSLSSLFLRLSPAGFRLKFWKISLSSQRRKSYTLLAASERWRLGRQPVSFSRLHINWHVFIRIFFLSFITIIIITGQPAIFPKPVTVWNPVRVPDEPPRRLGVEAHVRRLRGERSTRPNLRHCFSRSCLERRV